MNPGLSWSARLALLLLSVIPLAASDTRFSQALAAEDRTACGLTRLTSDQVAVIDALVRRDTLRMGSASTPPAGASAPTPTTFSQRLSADERRTAGITTLAEAEVARLNALVERFQGARLARSLLSPLATVGPSPSRVRSEDTKPERKIHGSFSLSYGWGKGGYSEKTGSMMLYYDDPEGRFSVSVGYTESQVKGGPQVYRDPYYEHPRGPLIEGPPYRP